MDEQAPKQEVAPGKNKNSAARIAANNRYNDKAYHRINIAIPKCRKAAVEAAAVEAAAKGLISNPSLNGLSNMLLRQYLGFSEDEWKPSHEEEAAENTPVAIDIVQCAGEDGDRQEKEETPMAQPELYKITAQSSGTIGEATMDENEIRKYLDVMNSIKPIPHLPGFDMLTIKMVCEYFGVRESPSMRCKINKYADANDHNGVRVITSLDLLKAGYEPRSKSTGKNRSYQRDGVIVNLDAATRQLMLIDDSVMAYLAKHYGFNSLACEIRNKVKAEQAAEATANAQTECAHGTIEMPQSDCQRQADHQETVSEHNAKAEAEEQQISTLDLSVATPKTTVYDNIKVFENDHLGSLRVLPDGDNVWFVATDICKLLDSSSPANALLRLDGKDKCKVSISTKGGKQTLSCVTKNGLMELVLSSRSALKKEVKAWLKNTVLPSMGMSWTLDDNYQSDTVNDMPELSVYRNKKFGNIRVQIVDGEPWFVAADVCEALEIANTPQAMGRIDVEDKRVYSGIYTANNTLSMWCVNEPGLYSLILESAKPEAKQFKHWITHEVIPAIRKQGAYFTPQYTEQMAKEICDVIMNPGLLTKLRAELEKKTAEAETLKKQIAENQQVMANILDAKNNIKHLLQNLNSETAYISNRAALISEPKPATKEQAGNKNKRGLLNDIVRQFSYDVYHGNHKAAWWCYYTKLKNDDGIDTTARLEETGSTSDNKLDMIRDDEFDVAIKCAIDMCRQNGVNIDGIVD